MNDSVGSGPAIPGLWLFDDAPIVGGAEIFALRLARFLASERGASALRIVCPADSELAERCRAEAIPHLPASFPELGARGAIRWPAATMAIRTLLRDAGAGSIAIGNSPRAQAYLSAAALLTRRRPAIVQVIHEQETLRRWVGRLSYRRLGALVAMGGNIAAACERAIPRVPVWEANLFLDQESADPAQPRPPSSEPTVGVLTRLIPEKGVIELVDELAGAGSWSRAVIAGAAQDPAYARKVEDRIAELGLAERITMAGYVTDLRSFFASIDVLIVPSTGSEGQGMATIEALWYGRPSLMRGSAWSARDFEGLPVLPFDGGKELEAGLRELRGRQVPRREVRERFGPEQALDAILAAARGIPAP